MKKLIDRNNEETALAQWRGARVQFWIFDVSLKRLALRLYRPHEAEVMYITAIGCDHIVGPFVWESSDISLEIEPPESEHPKACRVIDKLAGFELRCADVRIMRGPATDFDKTFENFLGEPD